jgi:23S rRNA pseudouridine1911/1915/1917 synthase
MMPDTTNSTTAELVVDTAGERLDVFVARALPGVTRSRVQRLIGAGQVRVEGQRARAGLRLEPGQRVRVDLPPAETAAAQAEAIPLDVIYEDADIIVINKPAGMTVHPGPGHRSSTLANALRAHSPELSAAGGEARPGIVHRLDRDTSGVIVVAKHDEAHHELARQLKARAVEKTYVALVEGTPKPAEGLIEAPVGRDPRHRQRMAVVEGGREALTAYRVIERFTGASLVEARPRTGRTHQIRVHLAAIGHPVVGDRVYGRTATSLVRRQFLHALRIAFAHPRTGERVEFEAALPDDLSQALAALRSGAARV